MTIFWILAAGLAVLAILFAIAPLLQASSHTAEDVGEATNSETDQARLNLSLFKQQLTELDADLDSGKLDQTVYESARRDLERELLNDLGDRDPLTAASGTAKPAGSTRLPGPQATAMALAVAIPVGALVLYSLIGSQALIPELERQAASGAAAQPAGGNALPPMEELVARLEQRLEQEPEDSEGWMMLGRTYFATGDRQQAERALARAYELNPADTMIVLTYAETIATNNDNQLEGRPAELISEALELDPDNTTARWLAAMVAFQRGQFRSAATSWKTLLDVVDPASEEAGELRSMIEEAEQRAGIPSQARQLASAAGADAAQPVDTGNSDAPSPATGGAAAEPSALQEPSAADASPPEQAATPVSASPPAASGGPGMRVSARLAPALEGRYPPSTTVFIFARAASGPPMPLAVQRLTLGDLPVEVRLDDSMAMMPAMRLSNFPQVVVGARVSPSSQAMPRPGDLEGEVGPLASNGDDPVTVVIDRVRR